MIYCESAQWDLHTKKKQKQKELDTNRNGSHAFFFKVDHLIIIPQASGSYSLACGCIKSFFYLKFDKKNICTYIACYSNKGLMWLRVVLLQVMFKGVW